MSLIQSTRYRFSLTANESMRLPEYKGSTLRGGFGHAFKKVVCTFKNRPCDDCLLKNRCVYSYIFETPPPENSVKMTKYLRAPHPFVIEPPPDTRQSYQAGDRLDFGLVLIGKAIEYLPYFIYAFQELGKIGIGKGKSGFRLEQVGQNSEIIYSAATETIRQIATTGPDTCLPDISDAKLLRMNFLTPTRIVSNEKLVAAPDFQTIFRALARRISMLSYFHCGKELEADYKGLIQQAGVIETIDRQTRWHDWERYSARQDERMKLGGFVGQMQFAGDFEPFYPWLEAGEMVHLGKGTAFGLGRYEIKKEEGA